MVVVSRSGTEYHRAEPLDDWEALRWRELEWSDLPKTMYRGLISCLTVREAGRLDCAMTNCEARPHLVKSYKGMESPGFNGQVYTGMNVVMEWSWGDRGSVDRVGRHNEDPFLLQSIDTGIQYTFRYLYLLASTGLMILPFILSTCWWIFVSGAMRW